MADNWDKYLSDVDKKGNAPNLKDLRKQMPNQYDEYGTEKIGAYKGGSGTILIPNARSTSFTFPSKAPAGMGAAVKGDLGRYRGEEADKQKNFKGDGRTGACAKRLSYRMPDTAIDAKFGPGDTVCG